MSENNSKNFKTPKILKEISGMVPNCTYCDALFSEVQPANANIKCPSCGQITCLTIRPDESAESKEDE